MTVLKTYFKLVCNCDKCPNVGNTSRHTLTKPVCSAANGKTLPDDYTRSRPDWCPLPDHIKARQVALLQYAVDFLIANLVDGRLAYPFSKPPKEGELKQLAERLKQF
jgi:hypothetical protein